VEVAGSNFERNMHYIPAIHYKFQKPQSAGNSLSFFDSSTTQEYQLSICSQVNYTDQYFFNMGFFYSDDLDSFFDSFERLSVIYISRNRDSTIIKDNTFKQNIGTFGGAISINSPRWSASDTTKLPYVVMRGNKFTGNMAYFSGNAIYIRPTMVRNAVGSQGCGSMDLTNN
jgi:hypothetical protein